MQAGKYLTRVAATAALIAASLTPATPVAAAPVTVSTTPVAGWRTNGPVYATAIIGDTVYVGGNFTQVRNQNGSQTAGRANLAAFDLTTGALRTGWAADTNGVVRALASDGGRLFVGGSFTAVRGVNRGRLAALDPGTGALLTGFVANASSHVYALAVQGDRLYVGGAFGNIGGATRTRVAAVDRTTGAVVPGFVPALDNSVRAVAASPDGATVYVGGQFTTLGGVAQPYFGQVSAATGANTGLTFRNPPTNQTIALVVSPNGRQIYTGAMHNRVAAYDTTSGARQWFQQADGDVQAVAYRDGNVYFGFHESFAGDTSVRVLAVDAGTGAIEPWRPTVNSFYGVWAIATSPDAVVIGGEFTQVTGVNVQGLAILRPGAADTTPPSPPTGLRVTTGTSGSVGLTWVPGGDDVGVSGYRITRDGTEVAVTATTSYVDTGLDGGRTYTYGVETIDTSGNRSGAVTIDARTGEALIAEGSVWRYSDVGAVPAGWQARDFADGGWSAGSAELGYGDSDEATVVGFGPNPNAKYRTTYFRRSFTVGDPDALRDATLHLRRDDGAVVYLNGVEIARSNMPGGAIAYATAASSSVGGADERTFFDFAVDPARFVNGTNVLAVEVHQRDNTSSDLSFEASLDATADPTTTTTSTSTSTSTSTTTSTTSTTTTTTTTTTPPGAVQTVFDAGAVWRFTEDGLDRGTAWRARNYDDATWRSGPGQLGYGDGDEATVMFNGGATTASRFISHFLRRDFDVTDAGAVTGLTLSVLRDDGVVVYVNGVEAFRDNMPTGTVTATTYASTGLFGAAESTFTDFDLPPSLLVEGRNVIAVSVHNNSRSGAGDLSFDARLTLRR
jgi:hypothetical protein